MLVYEKLAQFVEIINYKLENNAIMETKLDAKLAVFPILASLVLELLVLHQSALVLLISVETLFLGMVNNAIMVIKLDA